MTEAEDMRAEALVKEAFTRIREELVRRSVLFGDPTMTQLALVVKFDRKTGHVGAILCRPEYERVIRTERE